MGSLPQYSTVCSEIALAGSCIWAHSTLSRNSEIDYQFGKWWFMLEMLASTLGIAKFGQFLEKYTQQVEKYHRNFTWMTMSVGIPCLGAQFSNLYGVVSLSQIFLGMAVVGFLMGMRKPHLKSQVALIVPAVVLFVILGLFGIKESNFNLCCAVLLLVISSAIGIKGKLPLIQVLKVDFFHYLLVVVNYFLVQSLLPS